MIEFINLILAILSILTFFCGSFFYLKTRSMNKLKMIKDIHNSSKKRSATKDDNKHDIRHSLNLLIEAGNFGTKFSNPLAYFAITRAESSLKMARESIKTRDFYHEDLINLFSNFSSGLEAGQKLVQVIQTHETDRFVTIPFQLVVQAAKLSHEQKGSLIDILGSLSKFLYKRNINNQAAALERLTSCLNLLFRAEHAGCRMQGFIAALRDTELSKASLLRRLRHETLAVRFQAAVISLFPILILALTCLFSSEKFDFFFHTNTGILCLIIAFLMNIFGVFFVWLIVNTNIASVNRLL